MPPPTHLFFVASAGGGSTHLVASIRATGTPCVEKPNIAPWHPEQWPPVLRWPGRIPVAKLHEPPGRIVAKRFRRVQRRRCDAQERFAFDETKTLADNLLDYFAFLRSHGIACVLEARGLDGLLERAQLRQVVFLVRDPVQAYISFAKPQRHGRDIDALGGIESEDAIAFWAWNWGALADEYLRMRASGLDPLLVRYESAQADAERIGHAFLEQVFTSFQPRSNEVELSERARQRLLDLIGDRYERIVGPVGVPA